MIESEHRLKRRAPEENPLSGACRPHLRRICGVCEHFDAASIGAVGRCSELGFVASGLRSAKSCALWSRRMAGGQS